MVKISLLCHWCRLGQRGMLDGLTKGEGYAA
jgi:hypothetical protein